MRSLTITSICIPILLAESVFAIPLLSRNVRSTAGLGSGTTLETRAPWPKRGLPFNDPPTWINHFDGQGSQVNWAYNWNSVMHADFPSRYLEFVPMLWGDRPDKTDNWFKDADNALSRGSGHLLAFNEPDGCLWGQSCMNPQQAVDAFRKYLQPYASRASLGSPAVTSQDGVGLPWLRDFLNRCQGCKVDFVTVHWYGDWTQDGHFRWFIEEVGKVANGKKVWITEFTAFGDLNQQREFLSKIMPWLDNQDYVERYSWFWANPDFKQGALTKHDGWPTELGNTYAFTPFGRS